MAVSFSAYFLAGGPNGKGFLVNRHKIDATGMIPSRRHACRCPRCGQKGTGARSLQVSARAQTFPRGVCIVDQPLLMDVR